MSSSEVDADGGAGGVHLDTFDSLNPATGEVVGSYPIEDAAAVDAAVDRARIAAHWWAGLGFAGRAERLQRWKGVLTRRMAQLAEVSHAETGKPHCDAQLEIVLAIDHIAWAAKHAAKVLGAHRGSPGLLLANHGRHGRVRAARRGRRDRAVELPGLHADGLDRLRAGRRQRGGVQAQRVHPGVGQWLVDAFAEVVPEQPVFQFDHRSGRDRRRAVPRPGWTSWRSPARRATGKQGDGGLRRDADAGGDRGRRQGLAAGRRGRRPRRGGRCRRSGAAVQRGPDLHRRRAGLRARAGLRRVHRSGCWRRPATCGRDDAGAQARADHDAQRSST